MRCLLNRYSVSAPCPDFSLKFSFFAAASSEPSRRQREQLHEMTLSISVSTSNVTLPHWHEPEYFIEALSIHSYVMAGLVPAIHALPLGGKSVDARHKAGHDSVK